MVISFSPVLYFHCFFLYGVCDFFCLLCWWRKQPFANKHAHRRLQNLHHNSGNNEVNKQK